MGKRIAWFDMVSPQERKRREEEYNHKIFPFGLDQKEKELKILKTLIPDKKPEDSLYQTVLLKEIFLDALSEGNSNSFEECILNEKVEEDLSDWKKGVLVQNFSELERSILKKFAWKCLKIKDLGDLNEEINFTDPENE